MEGTDPAAVVESKPETVSEVCGLEGEGYKEEVREEVSR